MLQAYWYMTKMRILTTLAYRFEVFASIGTHFILMIASIFLWRAAYGGIDQVNDFKLEDLITYSVISIMLSSLFVHDVQNTIYNKIREGQIVTDFYRPISLLGSYLADDIGSMLSSVVNKALPLFLFAALFFDAPLPATVIDFLLFIPSCLLSYSILWLMSALIGLIAFWVMELGNMGIVKDSIVVILSGSMVPLWFFPESVQTVSRFLPFQYTYQTPIGIYIGVMNHTEAFQSMLIQLAWIVILFAILYVAWQRTKQKTLIQGG
jgi:ABC-2 type transport system permease protein